MEWFLTHGFIFLVLLCFLLRTSCFNLEPNLSVIKYGEKGSYFGFSVAQHQILDPDTKKVTDQVILVGAPKAQSPQPGTNHSGAVYRCKVSTLHKDCIQLPIDHDTEPPGEDVMKDDQWLGVTVKSQGPGGYVLACAHRYVLRGEDYQWGQGICYSLTPSLEVHRAWEPCLNRPVNRAHEQFGYCQAGTSAHISQDYNIVLGTPGPFTWRGTVFVNSIRFRIRDDKTWYSSPLLDDRSPVDKYSYLGMSVTSGKFFDEQLSYVGGAPRSAGSGQVLFFRKKRGNSNFEVQAVLTGEQFASSFGYSLAALDINDDRYLDLVVGAPFYYEKGAGGAAYVYLNSKEGINKDTRPIKLTGKSESRFGFALANVGDLNRDGFSDLAIGAPYEGDGAVYIYLGSSDGLVLEPSQVIRPRDLPKAALIRPELGTFGYSLSGGMDLDSNGYPDLLVGAYASSYVVLLRSRPVLDIITQVKGNFSRIDPDARGCLEDPTSTTVCFSFQACFQLNVSSHFSLSQAQQSVNLRYRIEGDVGTPTRGRHRKFHRVRFQSAKEFPHIVERDILVPGHRSIDIHCFRELVYLKDKSDIQSPIEFKLSYELIQKAPSAPPEGAPLTNINLFPILNQQEASKLFEATFLKDCGSNDICESELSVKAELSLPREVGGELPLLYLGERLVNLSITVINQGEPAYDAALFVSHSPSLSYVGRKTLRGDIMECSPVDNSTLQCKLGNPFKRSIVEVVLKFSAKGVADSDKEIGFEITANTTSYELTPRPPLLLLAEVVKVAELELRGVSKPDQAFYGAPVSPGDAGAPLYETDVGTLVIHTYEVINNGPWQAHGIKIKVSWPFEMDRHSQGRWLLYLMESPQVTGNGYCEVDPAYINPLNLTRDRAERSLSPLLLRARRDNGDASPEQLRLDGQNVEVVTLDCSRGTARCFHFTCWIRSLLADQTAVINIRARLWNATLVQEYPYVDWVRIVSRAHIFLDESLGIRQRTDDDEASAETKAYPSADLYQREKSIPLWIILVAAGCGLLLLIILILILWRLGFFKRKKPGYMPAETDEKPMNNY